MNKTMNNKDFYAVIMAGGVGSRFWPVSTEKYPKQFHDMLSEGKTLIQKTFHRLANFIPQSNILVLTNAKYKDIVERQLPEVERQNIILEPSMRNTAPCILYSAMKIRKQNPQAKIVVAPSDHWIEDEREFEQNIKTCFEWCQEKDALMTLGIVPTSPNTGFGYIECERGEKEIKKVVKFTEKPSQEKAEEFLREGNYLWNAGIFIWSTNSIVGAFEKLQRQMYDLFAQGLPYYNTEKEKDFIEENYHKAENISVDYAIMEKSDNTYVMGAKFDWSDLGTWGSLYQKLSKDKDKNAVVNAKTLLVGSRENIIRTEKGKKVIVDGLEGYIIVDEGDVLMIVPKSKEQQIKELSQKI